jgi:hypothetical protein
MESTLQEFITVIGSNWIHDIGGGNLIQFYKNIGLAGTIMSDLLRIGLDLLEWKFTTTVRKLRKIWT